MDFTDIGNNVREQGRVPQYRQVTRPSQAAPIRQQMQSEPTIDFPVDPEVERVKELEARRGSKLFNITETGGQIKAGEADEAYAAFLKQTTLIKDGE